MLTVMVDNNLSTHYIMNVWFTSCSVCYISVEDKSWVRFPDGMNLF